MIAKFPVVVSHQHLDDRRSLPRFDQMSNGEDDTKHNADTANDNIGNAQEGVLAAHDGPG